MITSALHYARCTGLIGATFRGRSSHHFRVTIAPLKQKSFHSYYFNSNPNYIRIVLFFNESCVLRGESLTVHRVSFVVHRVPCVVLGPFWIIRTYG